MTGLFTIIATRKGLETIRTHAVTPLYEHLYVYVCTQVCNLFPHTRDVARCNNLIGLFHLSRACVNCREKLDGCTLYSPLILPELIPQTNHCGSVLSTNLVMLRRVLKSSTLPCLECFLLVNGSRNRCMMSQGAK